MKKKVYKFSIKSYYQPTPANIRKLGDALLGSCQFATGYAVISENTTLAIICITIGTIGKFLSNFFTEYPNGTNQNTTGQV